MKKALIFLFDGFAEFEVNIASLFLISKQFEIITATVDGKTVTGEGGFLCQPHVSMEHIEVADYELFIVPGGHIFDHLENDQLLSIVNKLHEQNKWIAGICAGTSLLHAAGVVNNKKFSTSLTSDEKQLAHLHEWEYKQNKDVTVDGKIITAVGSAYVEFATEIMKQLNLFNEAEAKENLQYFKNVTEICDGTLV
ncbi:glutamine amidotransferase [Bacillus anthracis]|uniref:ThiJ/PfpI family protein n=1 Tax=Bacillus thuringiensis subsp. konkukian (strain 97-27) TaxID=281309 RepID=Q6HKT8_BACHK|nr:MULTISPECIES: DJ-1/PfpI family protein [Bacillus cereus group]MBL3850120.1 DJ-1/PfpI family protein [Bacillus cereus]AAT59501.1 thiJ/PfpI family protein [[Bacillus thuringiensis] serovar konkukian str. 97-27]AJI32926.1 DJ-1/PfpI family protein [Bacillus thuringiensis]MDR4408528.1 glutamine amidotransferase [Bacillus anthracis]QKI24214.1 DJ-1/PfpI family protein [Bacillus thuringiensis]